MEKIQFENTLYLYVISVSVGHVTFNNLSTQVSIQDIS